MAIAFNERKTSTRFLDDARLVGAVARVEEEANLAEEEIKTDNGSSKESLPASTTQEAAAQKLSAYRRWTHKRSETLKRTRFESLLVPGKASVHDFSMECSLSQ